MSDLVAIAYPDQSAVERAREGLREGVKAGVIDVEDVVVLVRDEDALSTSGREQAAVLEAARSGGS